MREARKTLTFFCLSLSAGSGKSLRQFPQHGLLYYISDMHSQLTKLIGKRFRYRGQAWIIVEVMRDEDALVIVPEQAARERRIQADQYGNATRRCNRCVTLPLSDPEDPDSYSPQVMELLAGSLAE